MSEKNYIVSTENKSYIVSSTNNTYVVPIEKNIEILSKTEQGPRGPIGLKGDDGEQGSSGKSAYELAVENGFVGTEQEWLDSLVAESLVKSVNTRTGDIVLSKSDVGLSNVDNTSDLDKPISTATQSALANKANLSHAHPISDITNLEQRLTTPDVDYVVFHTNFNSTSAPNSSLFWDSVDGTINAKLSSDVTLQIGQELHFYGKAQGDISKGDLVQFAGVQGDHILFKKSVASEVKANPHYLIGVATHNISNGSFGYITWFGAVRDIDTVTPGWAAGDILYFDNDTGGLTKVVPTTGIRKIIVAVVQKAATSAPASNGILLVRPELSHQLSLLEDVETSSLQSGQILYWDSITAKWKNKTLSKSDIGLGSVEDGAQINNVFISDTQPSTTVNKYMWIDTSNGNISFWIETGE